MEQRVYGPGLQTKNSDSAPIHGSFIPVSPVNRSRLYSPRKKVSRRQQNHVHVQVNVTDAQMDRLAFRYCYHMPSQHPWTYEFVAWRTNPVNFVPQMIRVEAKKA